MTKNETEVLTCTIECMLYNVNNAIRQHVQHSTNTRANIFGKKKNENSFMRSRVPVYNICVCGVCKNYD